MISEKQIYDLIKTIIDDSSKTFIEPSEIYVKINKQYPLALAYVRSSEGSSVFHRVIDALVKEQVITPTQSAKIQRKIDGVPLFSKYKITMSANKTIVDTGALTKLFKLKGIKYDYYSKHLDEFLQDESIIETVSRFIQSRHSNELSVHERSWELFGDEKFLYNPDEKARGEIVLKNLGLTLADLKCYHTYEPFIYYQLPSSTHGTETNILILENKDTYWTFQKLLQLRMLRDYDMVIYGEGNKIVSSLKYLEKVNDKEINRIGYFGDIDREGFDIYNRLLNAYGGEYSISLSVRLYQWLLDKVQFEHLKQTKKEQRYNPEVYNKILDDVGFDDEYKNKILQILREGRYVPQESLNYHRLCRLLGDS